MKESKVLYDKLQGEFWLTRIVFVKWLSVLYFVAFSVALFQNEGLLGDKGLTPAISYIKRYHGHFNNTHHHNMTTAMDWQENLFHDKPWTEEAAHHRIGFMHHPTVFWFLPPSTTYLYICAACGMLISALIFMMGSANSVLYAVLWLLYFSIVNVGQTWYSFGWESQLLETGLLAVFMVPVVNCFTRFPTYTPAPYSVVVLYRWLLFRIMIGAGMIKIRGDECWRDLTCMHYHYQTQPVPNPISMYFHYNHGKFHSL